jgi:zinc protease
MSSQYRFPPFTEEVLANGIRLICIPDDEQDGFVIMHQFPFGTFSDPEGKEGAAELTISLMQKGIDGVDPETFSEKFEHAGATLFSDVAEERSTLGVRMLESFQEQLLPLFFGMLKNPSLMQSELSRLKREMVTALQAEQVEPSVIAQRHFSTEIAGKQHPAGRFHSVKATSGIHLNEIKSFYATHVQPARSIIVAAGKFDQSGLKGAIESSIGQWNIGSSVDSEYAPALNLKPPALRFIDKSDSTQATLIIGHEAPGEIYPERNALILANYTLGGGNFSSRLMSRIRSEGGRTYGIHSQIAMQKQMGIFSVATSTQNNQAQAVIKGILDTLKEFTEHGITQEELDNARRYYIGNMAFQLEGISNVAEKILWLRSIGLSESYIENYAAMLNAITLDKVNEVIKEVFRPENLKVVVVGKKNEILPQLSIFGTFKIYHFRDAL